MGRVKSNADLFSFRGDSWDAVSRREKAWASPLEKIPRTSPTGKPRLSLSARHAVILRPSSKPPAASRSDIDLDVFLCAGRALPFQVKLAKERNLSSPSMNNVVAPSTTPRLVVNARTIFNKKKASRLIKVK